MHIKYLQDEKGIGLVEVLAAFSVSIVVLTALVSLALYTMRSSLNSKLLLEGTKIATREIERVRAYRDSSANWTTFANSLNVITGGINCTCRPTTCIDDVTVLKCSMGISPLTPSAGAITETIDNQKVTHYFNVTPDANDPDNILRVTVNVSWNIGGVLKSTHVYTDLTNWKTQ